MRLPRDSLLFLLLVIAFCLILGIVVGIRSRQFAMMLGQASPTAHRAAPAGTSPRAIPPTSAPNLQSTPSPGQMALLIVGIADANSLQPKFEGCWVVAFSPGINQYYVLSFPPEARFQVASLGGYETLSDIYAQDVQQEVGHRFIRDAIHSVFPAMALQADVTLDRSDLADLVYKVGGLSIGGDKLQGSGLANAYDSQSFIGETARLEFQRQAFLALFQALASQHWSPASVAVYLEQLPHAVRPEDAATLNLLANSAPALQEASEVTWTVVGGAHETATIP